MFEYYQEFNYYDADLGDYTHYCRLDQKQYQDMFVAIIYEAYFWRLDIKDKEQIKKIKNCIYEFVSNFDMFYDSDFEKWFEDNYREEINEYLFRNDLYRVYDNE